MAFCSGKLGPRGCTIPTFPADLNNVFKLDISEREKITESLRSKLIALNPGAVLERGYSIVFRKKDSKVVTDQSMVKKGDEISI